MDTASEYAIECVVQVSKVLEFYDPKSTMSVKDRRYIADKLLHFAIYIEGESQKEG